MDEINKKLKDADDLLECFNKLLAARNHRINDLNDEIHELHLALQQAHKQIVELRNKNETA